jgi:hypothetical protein
VLDGSRRLVVTPGTPVLIVGTPAYGAPPPWIDIPALARPIALPEKVR